MAAAQSQTAAKKTVVGRKTGAVAMPRLMAVIGVTTPMTTSATAMVFTAVASSFVCSS
ncbi:MAG: hypothetical protein INR70_02225 [Parafilimonas terrae]|nr:hypothetical protein [Parafilimonas terrae]